MKIYNELESLGFFEWLSETHNLKDTDMKPEYLDELPLDDIHRTVCNSMALRWFREKYGICSWIDRLYTDDHVLYYRYTCEKSIESPPNYNKTWITLKEYNTYEEAELACLNKLIEIIKKK
jgi:hypothetical protein